MFLRIFALFAVLFVFTAKGYIEVSDTALSVETAESILSRHALDVPYADGATFRARDGRSYSKYGLGLAITYVPVVAAARVASRVSHLPESALIGFFVSFVNVPFSLLLLWTFKRLLERWRVEEARVALLVIGLGLGTLCWRYAGYDFSEAMQGALLLVVYEATTRGERRDLVIGGSAYGFLLLVKLVYAAFFPLFAAFILFHASSTWSKRIRDLVAFCAPIAVAILFVFSMNAIRFGNPLESGYGGEANQFIARQLATTVPKLLLSFDKGLLVFSPIVILGLLGWRGFVRERRAEAALAASCIVVNLLLAGAWHSWMGGCSWGPRLLVPVIALWLAPAAFWLQSGNVRRRFAIAAAVTGVSIVSQVSGVLVKDQEIHDIAETMLTPTEREQMISEMSASYVLLAHKLRGREEVYVPRDFGVADNRPIDLRAFGTLRGLNLWTEQLADHLHKPRLRWLGVIGGLASLSLFFSSIRELRRRARTPGRFDDTGVRA
ncbi:MAG: hypothetical protein ACHREM_02850 [Polyangiales bacterium]